MSTAPTIEVTAGAGQLLGMTTDAFLQAYWQKHPLLIRQALPNFELPLQPDDLGGLGCEETALSRLIERDREHDRWTVHSGPLEESLFARLPDHDWTLLVQDVDKWDADVARLIEPFRFLPGWRIDDVMISYAEDRGGVGAHIDQYDVFLIQGLGQRRWSIDARPNPPTAFRDDVELKQLRQFDPSHSWTLEPGDMLYLPPGVPHDGVAIGPCMTFSIGMRAPSAAEFLLDFSEHLAERLSEDQRYGDADLQSTSQPGRIDAAALDRVRATLGPIAGGTDAAALMRWFGGFITRYRSARFAVPPTVPCTRAQLRQALQQGQTLAPHPWTRFAWATSGPDTLLFAAGECLPCPQPLAQALCRHQSLGQADIATADALTAALTLANQGHLLVTDADA